MKIVEKRKYTFFIFVLVTVFAVNTYARSRRDGANKSRQQMLERNKASQLRRELNPDESIKSRSSGGKSANAPRRKSEAVIKKYEELIEDGASKEDLINFCQNDLASIQAGTDQGRIEKECEENHLKPLISRVNGLPFIPTIAQMSNPGEDDLELYSKKCGQNIDDIEDFDYKDSQKKIAEFENRCENLLPELEKAVQYAREQQGGKKIPCKPTLVNQNEVSVCNQIKESLMEVEEQNAPLLDVIAGISLTVAPSQQSYESNQLCDECYRNAYSKLDNSGKDFDAERKRLRDEFTLKAVQEDFRNEFNRTRELRDYFESIRNEIEDDLDYSARVAAGMPKGTAMMGMSFVEQEPRQNDFLGSSTQGGQFSSVAAFFPEDQEKIYQQKQIEINKLTCGLVNHADPFENSGACNAAFEAKEMLKKLEAELRAEDGWDRDDHLNGDKALLDLKDSEALFKPIEDLLVTKFDTLRKICRHDVYGGTRESVNMIFNEMEGGQYLYDELRIYLKTDPSLIPLMDGSTFCTTIVREDLRDQLLANESLPDDGVPYTLFQHVKLVLDEPAVPDPAVLKVFNDKFPGVRSDKFEYLKGLSISHCDKSVGFNIVEKACSPDLKSSSYLKLLQDDETPSIAKNSLICEALNGQSLIITGEGKVKEKKPEPTEAEIAQEKARERIKLSSNQVVKVTDGKSAGEIAKNISSTVNSTNSNVGRVITASNKSRPPSSRRRAAQRRLYERAREFKEKGTINGRVVSINRLPRNPENKIEKDSSYANEDNSKITSEGKKGNFITQEERENDVISAVDTSKLNEDSDDKNISDEDSGFDPSDFINSFKNAKTEIVPTPVEVKDFVSAPVTDADIARQIAQFKQDKQKEKELTELEEKLAEEGKLPEGGIVEALKLPPGGTGGARLKTEAEKELERLKAEMAKKVEEDRLAQLDALKDKKRIAELEETTKELKKTIEAAKISKRETPSPIPAADKGSDGFLKAGTSISGFRDGNYKAFPSNQPSARRQQTYNDSVSNATTDTRIPPNLGGIAKRTKGDGGAVEFSQDSSGELTLKLINSSKSGGEAFLSSKVEINEVVLDNKGNIQQVHIYGTREPIDISDLTPSARGVLEEYILGKDGEAGKLEEIGTVIAQNESVLKIAQNANVRSLELPNPPARKQASESGGYLELLDVSSQIGNEDKTN